MLGSAPPVLGNVMAFSDDEAREERMAVMLGDIVVGGDVEDCEVPTTVVLERVRIDSGAETCHP